MASHEQRKIDITVTGPHEDGLYEARVTGTDLWVRARSERAALQSLVAMMPENEAPVLPMDA